MMKQSHRIFFHRQSKLPAPPPYTGCVKIYPSTAKPALLAQIDNIWSFDDDEEGKFNEDAIELSTSPRANYRHKNKALSESSDSSNGEGRVNIRAYDHEIIGKRPAIDVTRSQQQQQPQPQQHRQQRQSLPVAQQNSEKIFERLRRRHDHKKLQREAPVIRVPIRSQIPPPHQGPVPPPLPPPQLVAGHKSESKAHNQQLNDENGRISKKTSRNDIVQAPVLGLDRRVLLHQHQVELSRSAGQGKRRNVIESSQRSNVVNDHKAEDVVVISTSNRPQSLLQVRQKMEQLQLNRNVISNHSSDDDGDQQTKRRLENDRRGRERSHQNTNANRYPQRERDVKDRHREQRHRQQRHLDRSGNQHHNDLMQNRYSIEDDKLRASRKPKHGRTQSSFVASVSSAASKRKQKHFLNEQQHQHRQEDRERISRRYSRI